MQHPHVVKHHTLTVLQPVAQQTRGAVADLELDNGVDLVHQAILAVTAHRVEELEGPVQLLGGGHV